MGDWFHFHGSGLCFSCSTSLPEEEATLLETRRLRPSSLVSTATSDPRFPLDNEFRRLFQHATRKKFSVTINCSFCNILLLLISTDLLHVVHSLHTPPQQPNSDSTATVCCWLFTIDYITPTNTNSKVSTCWVHFQFYSTRDAYTISELLFGIHNIHASWL